MMMEYLRTHTYIFVPADGKVINSDDIVRVKDLSDLFSLFKGAM